MHQGNKEVKFKNELRQLTESIKNTKSTSDLFKFKELIDVILEQEKKKILLRNDLANSIESLNNLIPSKLLDGLLDKSIELDDNDLCNKIINNVQFLDESQACKCIKYYLKNMEISDDEKNHLTIDKKLDLIFKKQFDYRLFSNELKKLSSNEFIICLQYLQDYLKNSFHNKLNSNEKEQQDSPPFHQSNSRPNILQVIELFSSFVDAHFTHITLSNKAQEIIADVLQLIETQLDSFLDLISIESLIREIKQNNLFEIKNNNNIGHYYIEVLKLK